MRRALLGLVVALSTVSCDGAPRPAFPAEGATSTAGASVVDGALAQYLTEHGRQVVVTRVIDGDTIAVTGDERVRLLTIDSPELRTHTKADDADCGAVEARDALAAEIPVGNGIILNSLKGEPATDRYGRTLSNVYAPIPSKPGAYVNVSLWLVEQGRARAFEAYPTADSNDAQALQAQAQAARVGVWGSCPVPA